LEINGQSAMAAFFWFCGYLKWHGDGAEWMVPIE
jgi:hypothetical protein